MMVRAQVRYLSDTHKHSAETPIYHASQPGTREEAQHEGQFNIQTVEIKNARGLVEQQDNNNNPLSIDRQGFQLIRHAKTTVQDFFNDDELNRIYNQEVANLLLSNVPGNPKRVHIFDHTRRASTAEARTQLQCREPSAVIHNDYTEKSAIKRLGDILGSSKEEVEGDFLKQNNKRFSIVNVWRSIKGTVKQSPLAFCDSTSLSMNGDDLVSVTRVAKDRIGEIQMAFYNPNHQWYYFPNMTMDEAVIFKTFDSSSSSSSSLKDDDDSPKMNQFTIHTAFTDPSVSSDDAHPRLSIETRAFVFYDE